jgi:type IV secretion system protein VirB10
MVVLHRIAKYWQICAQLTYFALRQPMGLPLNGAKSSIHSGGPTGEGKMCLLERRLKVACMLSFAAGAMSVASAQSSAVSETSNNSSEQPPAASTAAPAAQAANPPQAPQKKKYTVPAGTKVLLQLRSGINTRSARAGDGVYLASTFPVVVGNKVMIPSGVYVQGVVDRVERAGHVKGKAQLDMHFTSIIFPNGSVVEIPGMVNSMPGAKKQSVKNDGEGTIEQDTDKTRNMGKVAAVAIPTGATVGSIGGLDSDHALAGGLAGIGAGLATAGIVSLFTRGADVNIESGTQVEMVLQRPLILEEENLAGVGAVGSAPALVPSPDQPKPIDKPNRARVLCPPGGLGCQ